MEERKTINPAEIDWDEMSAIMQRHGWKLRRVVVIHEEQNIIAELNPDPLSDLELLDVILEAICTAGQVKGKTRVQ